MQLCQRISDEGILWRVPLSAPLPAQLCYRKSTDAGQDAGLDMVAASSKAHPLPPAAALRRGWPRPCGRRRRP
jgi:hypothetical protein